MTHSGFKLAALSAALALAGCGGGGSSGVDRGALIDAPVVVATITKAMLDADANPLKALTGPAKCDVKVVALNYTTIGVTAEAANSSGVMLVPSGTGCTDATALVAFARGTEVSQVRTLANPSDSQTFALAAIFAAQGYTVVATDYLGFAKSTYPYHPYLHSDSEASSVIDSIRAARKAASTVGANLSGKVMVSGYSQGGHASMAAHRAIERDNAAEINLVAGAHLAGPYNLSGSLKVTNAIAGTQFFTTFIVTAWQKIYGDIYAKASDVFKAPYVDGIESLLPSKTLTYNTLITTGKLPYGNGVPSQARDELFTAAFTADSQTNDQSKLFLNAKKNDLLEWTPKSKLMMCGGAADPTVPPAVHLDVLKAIFAGKNLTNVTTIDVDATIQANHGIDGKAPTPATPDKFGAYYGAYHGELEPPLCQYEAKKLFDTVK